MSKQDIPQADTTQDDIVSNILEFLPAECGMTVNLPSKGLFYKNGTSEVKIKPLDFEGEKRLLSIKRSDLNPVDVLMDLCVEGIDINDLCAMDRLYLMVKIREVSNGEELNTVIPCKECSKDVQLNIMLSQLNVTRVPDDATDPHTIHLDMIKKDAVVRMPRVRDDKYLKTTTLVLDNLWRFVISIGGYTDAPIIAKVINKLPTRDRHKLIKEIMHTEYGVDTKVKFVCDGCEGVNIIDLPLTEDFFTSK